SSYIEREKKNLDELYSSLLFKFTTYHSRRPKKTTTYLASLGQRSKELIASARDAYMERLDSSDLPASQKAMLVRIAGLRDADTSSANKNEIDVTEEDGALSLPNAKRMLKWLAEGVGRGLELSGGNETPKDVKELLNLLLANMGELYLDTALDAADGMAASQESAKGEPDLSYILDLRAAIGILHLMVTCIYTVLIPLAASNLTIRRDLEKSTTNFVNRMEERVNSIMQRTIDASLTY
ncbi:Exocyst complex component 5, partial [Cryomyces antarcticus]